MTATFSYISITLYAHVYRQNVATIDDAARDIGQMFIRIVSTLPYAIHPVNNWNEVRGSKANFEPAPIPQCVLCIPFYFPWEYLPGSFETEERLTLFAVMLIARAASGRRFGRIVSVESEILGGRGGEKLRSSGKELILSLLFRYFTTGAQNVQFVIMIRKWATVGGCRYSVMRYYHAFGKI